MILNVSGRTDIVAFYSDWFRNRYQEGYVDVRNPFYPKQVSRIYFEDVDAIVFCTKNPLPIIDYLEEIKKPILFQVTLTSYGKDIEVGVPNKKDIIAGIKRISEILGKEFLYVRYDPILLNDRYDIRYHKKMFARLCDQLEGYVEHFIVSFIDDYKNVRSHQSDLNLHPFQKQDLEEIGKEFGSIALERNMTIQTCWEKVDFTQYGFLNEVCLSPTIAFRLTGKTNFPKWKARNCGCVNMVDIGVYNSCLHFCKYCYANFDEKKVRQNYREHDPHSSLLIGHLQADDIVKIRKK